jgi:hypothetical protein
MKLNRDNIYLDYINNNKYKNNLPGIFSKNNNINPGEILAYLSILSSIE